MGSSAVQHDKAAEEPEALSREESTAARALPTQAQPLPLQSPWAATPLGQRLRVLRTFRHELASLAASIPAALTPELARTPADTLAAELLPLLEACRFLEREAATILRARRLGRRGLPFWLRGTHAQVERTPLGTVLIIAPSNYPLFLPGVQALQALAAGNNVILKPGRGGERIAQIFAGALFRAGLPGSALQVTGEAVEDAVHAIHSGVDKIFFTGSSTSGQQVLHLAAESITPCVVELSGCDAAIILPSADLDRTIAALAFGMRLNASATCMAPRRVLLLDHSPQQRQHFLARLRDALSSLPQVNLPPPVERHLTHLIADARQLGATVIHEAPGMPVLVLGGRPQMQIAQADIFAPVLTVIDVQGLNGLLSAQHTCPFALTASIFGHQRAAREIASHLQVGVVTINDIIVPTADPRIPFGGRRQSGFGETRGREGLLAMTAPRVVSVRRGRSLPHLQPTGPAHQSFFEAVIGVVHGAGLRHRWRSLGAAVTAARKLNSKS